MAARGERAAGAAPAGRPRRLRLRAWLAEHRDAAAGSLRRLAREPLSSLMTLAVIGIALALPAGLHVLLANAQAVTGGWRGEARISLFLERGVDPARARALRRELAARPGVRAVELVTPEQALAEFRRLSGFGEALDALDENPLPATLVVTPAASDPEALVALAARLRALPEVEAAQLDLEWVRRLHAILALARRGVAVVAALLAAAVLLVVGNTIRLEIQNRREEIVVAKLIGATDGFIRRPFLYSGLWHGLLGAALAWLLVEGALALLAGPAARLAELYASAWRPAGLGAAASLALLAGGAALGLAGAWLAVARHLREIEPA